MGKVSALKPRSATWASFASSSFVMTGSLRTIWRQDSGSGTRRFRSGPTVDSIDVTSSSRIWSRGGLVTCAKSCLK